MSAAATAVGAGTAAGLASALTLGATALSVASMLVVLGWEAMEDHYQGQQRTVRRWMRQAGAEDLIARRCGYVRKLYAARGMPTAFGSKPKFPPELPGGHPALAFMPVRRMRRRYEGAI